MGEDNVTKKENKEYVRELMKKILDNIQSLVILILVIIILLMRACSGNGGKREINIDETRTKIDTVKIVDTVTVDKEVYVPKWRTKVVTKYDTIKEYVEVPQDIDTINILKDYYSKYAYLDTLSFDTLGFAVVRDTITENNILNRNYTYNINRYTEQIRIIEYINETEFYAGLGSRANGSTINYMGVEGLIRSKKGNTYLIGVGLNQNQELTFGGGVYWKFLTK